MRTSLFTLWAACAVSPVDTDSGSTGFVPATVPTVGALPSDPTVPSAPEGPVGLPFAVDDHYAASGYMGDAELGGLTDTPDCPARAGEARGACHRLVWTPAGAGWAGVYWQYPENNWGQSPGLAIQEGASGVHVWLWSTSEVQAELFVGGIAGVNADPFNVRATVLVTPEPTEHVLSLEGNSYERVIGGFGVSVGGDPVGPVTLFVDDIAWQ